MKRLNPRALHVLRLLSQPATVLQVARAAQLHDSTASSILLLLLRKGLVTRDAGETPRAPFLWQRTAEGDTLVGVDNEEPPVPPLKTAVEGYVRLSFFIRGGAWERLSRLAVLSGYTPDPTRQLAPLEGESHVERWLSHALEVGADQFRRIRRRESDVRKFDLPYNPVKGQLSPRHARVLTALDTPLTVIQVGAIAELPPPALSGVLASLQERGLVEQGARVRLGVDAQGRPLYAPGRPSYYWQRTAAGETWARENAPLGAY